MSNLITEAGFDLALDAASKAAAALEDPTASAAGLAAIKVLRDRKGMLVGHAEDAVKKVFTHAVNGEADEAELEYLRSRATVDELIYGMDQDTIGVVKEKARVEKAKAEFKALMWDMTMTGIKIALPLLLAAL